MKGAIKAVILISILAIGGITGCAKNTITETDPPVPMPPLKPSPDQPVEAQGVPLKQGTTITVEDPAPKSSGPRSGDPAELANLLNMKSTFSKDDTAVKQMRPDAIRDAARMVTLQTAIAWRYGQLLNSVYQHSHIMDTAFNFSPLLMTQGDALILPPVLARSGASMRIEDNDTATTSATSYEMLQKAKYVSVTPHWRTYLMAEGFPQPEQPNAAVLPKNAKEREIWREAVRKAWEQGVEEADELFLDNLSRLVRDYRGVMLYHMLTAQDLMSRVHTAHADLGMKISSGGNRLNIGQKVYRITAPSRFEVPKTPKVQSQKKKSKKRK